MEESFHNEKAYISKTIQGKSEYTCCMGTSLINTHTHTHTHFRDSFLHTPVLFRIKPNQRFCVKYARLFTLDYWAPRLKRKAPSALLAAGNICRQLNIHAIGNVIIPRLDSASWRIFRRDRRVVITSTEPAHVLLHKIVRGRGVNKYIRVGRGEYNQDYIMVSMNEGYMLKMESIILASDTPLAPIGCLGSAVGEECPCVNCYQRRNGGNGSLKCRHPTSIGFPLTL